MKREKILALGIFFSGLAGLWYLKHASPLLRLLAVSIGLIWIIKLAGFIWQRADGVRLKSPWGMLAFFLIWPGISLAGFTECAAEPPVHTGARFLEAWLTFLTGAALLLAVSLLGKGESTILNYLGLLAVLLMIHLGLLEVMADALRLTGLSPTSLFDRPYLATSLRDFWSNRWNRAFVEMNKLFFSRPLHARIPQARLTLLIFAISGLLHELGISYADGVSWGHPLLYFILQGVGMRLEKNRKFPRFLVWSWILLPMPLLFTPAFTHLFIGGLSHTIFNLADGLSKADFIRYGFLLGGTGHLLVLCASVQVPGKLGWRDDFQKLRPLNRKVCWTYGLYIFSIILFLSIVSFVLSGQGSQGAAPSILLWVLFTSLFWWARLLIDFFYMKHGDWPQGPLFTVGHVCLSTLFLSLALSYTAIGYLLFEIGGGL